MKRPRARSWSATTALGLAAAGLASVLAAAGCGKAKPVLSLYTWSDYIKPGLVRRFEQEQGCRILIDTFDSNEAMYAKIKAGATGYDILMPSSYMVSLMFEQNMLLPLNHSQLPNVANVDSEFLKITIDKTMHHSVPYMLTISGIAYLEDRVKGFSPTWGMFDRADLKGRMTMLNDMRETIGAALKLLGYSINTLNERELEEAEAVLVRWKRNLAKFDNEQYKIGLASGEFLLVYAYNGDVLQIQKENPRVRFVVPNEGTIIACDDLVIPRRSRRQDLAHAFINFLHDPKVAAENTNSIYFLCPNRAAYPLLSPAIINNPGIFLEPDILSKSEIIENLSEFNAAYVRVWDRVKSAK